MLKIYVIFLSLETVFLKISYLKYPVTQHTKKFKKNIRFLILMEIFPKLSVTYL